MLPFALRSQLFQLFLFVVGMDAKHLKTGWNGTNDHEKPRSIPTVPTRSNEIKTDLGFSGYKRVVGRYTRVLHETSSHIYDICLVSGKSRQVYEGRGIYD